MQPRARPTPTFSAASARAPLAAVSPSSSSTSSASAYPVASSSARALSRGSSNVPTRAAKAKAQQDDASGWEDELDKLARQPKPPSALSVASSSSSSSASSPSSPNPLSASASAPVSPSPPTPSSPTSPPDSFSSRPSSSSSSYRSSFGRPHGPAASALTHATLSFASELSHLEEHPAFLSLSSSLHSLPFLSTLSSRLGVSELPLASLLLLTAALSFVWGVGVMGAVDLLLFLYSAYLSYHALESSDASSDDADADADEDAGADPAVRHWLLFWSLYGLVSLVTGVTDRLWDGWLYRLVRTGVVVAMVVERWRVCEVLWEWLLGPLWSSNEAAVEAVVDRAVDALGQLVDDCKVAVKEGVVWYLRGGASAPPSASVKRKAGKRRAQ